MSKWADIVHRAYNPKDEVSIGIVGKYVEYEDSYKSLKEALVHGALAMNLKLKVTWLEAEGLETTDEPVAMRRGFRTGSMKSSSRASTAFLFPADSASAALKAC
jgi:CTP synthase (UTP-ammonia lyase)